VAFETKVYVVQKFDREGREGPVIAVKLTHATAHDIAKRNAPAKVIFAVADKDPSPNVMQNGAKYKARD
jgi:hypothetical protein